MSTHVGRQGAASPPNSSWDVLPSSPFGEKGGRTHDLPRPPTWPPASGPTGRCLHHPGIGALNQQGTDQGPVLPSVQAPKITRVSTMWARTEELVGDMVSSLKNCLRWKGGQPPRGLEESEPAAAQPSESKTPRRRRRDTSTERDLTKAREAHQRALAAMATLEERIERLSLSISRGQPDACTQSWSCDCWRRRSWGGTGGATGPCWKIALSILLSTALPSGTQEPGKVKGLNCLFWSLTWGHHQSWDQMSTTFSRSWPAVWGKAVEVIPPQNPQQRNMEGG